MSEAVSPSAEGTRIDPAAYRLDLLRQDGEFMLYRGQCQDYTDTTLRSTLVVAPVSDHPAPGSLRRLEHEYALRSALESAWAVRPLALIQRQGRPLLFLEDPGGAPLEQLLGAPLELGLFLRVAVSLAAALRALHTRGLIHKDLKPAHVLVNVATGQVWLTGFGLASRLPRERPTPAPPEILAGTLAYMAPEQTGRMNRSIDTRSDLYSLGVTLYELLTSTLPFTAAEPLEWVHCHIARQPMPPDERRHEVPAPLSALVMKLLAKTPEERYQTAAGVGQDLRRCLAQWEAEHRIEDFSLGEHDTPDRLRIPEKLYGREREIKTLLAAFERVVTSGRPELVLVSGYAGIGKSSVVNELHRVLVPQRGLFAAGKFEQYKRDIPYATLAQAVQSLIRSLLGKSEAELEPWCAALREAVGPNGRLMTELVPELALILGEQPPVPELPLQDAQRRFQLVFGRFLGVFARPEHPLALFLDDLQWLDAATLDLLEDLLTQSNLRHLLLIGAYRDNEVTAAHPLRHTLEVIKAAGGRVEEIRLVPLACEDVGQLMAETLHCEVERAAPLAQLVYDKTAGNPFFVVQFLAALTDEGLLTFEPEAARWAWELERIHAKGYTDNVADLMVAKLARLPGATQEALQQVACLGHKATVATLARVRGATVEQVHAVLWDPVQLELIERLDDSYIFVHDRVQEAAYSLIPQELRAAVHLHIGRVLLEHTAPEQRKERIFELVTQLNHGAGLIITQEEREHLAELNLVAGQRATASTAYASALKYLSAGAALLPEDAWERRHDLRFALELHRAECEFLTGVLAEAEQRLATLSTHAANTTERAAVTCLRVDLYTTLGQTSRAVAVGLDYLRHLGVQWSPHPTDEDVRREFARIWSDVTNRTLEDVIALPLMTDSASLATMDVLAKIGPPALFREPNFYILTVCLAVKLSLEQGNSDGSCDAYVRLGVIAAERLDDYQAGFRCGEIGYELVERRGLTRFQARTYLFFGAQLMPYTRHIRAGRDLLRRGFEIATTVGDLTFAGWYNCFYLTENLLGAGDPLVEVHHEAEQGLAFAQQARASILLDFLTGHLGLVRTLRGLTPTFGSFDDGQLDELQTERRFAANPDLARPAWSYWVRKLQARCLACDYASAVEASSRAKSLLPPSLTPLEAAEYHLYSALSHAACCDTAPVGQRQYHVEAVVGHYTRLELLADSCPDNFESRAAVVGAEIARLEGRDGDAMRLYEQAIRSAHVNGFIHHEALAHELAARFYATRGVEKIANTYLRDARRGYLRWGAEGKVRQLDELYPHLAEEAPAPAPTSTVTAPLAYLDLATVLTASQAVAGELVLDKLIDTLLRTVIEHAGAVRGLLLVPHGQELRLAAEATTRGDTLTVHVRDQAVDAALLPESILYYVVRTHERVLLDDVTAPHPFAGDEYLRRQHAHSVLCLPLLKQATLIGVLYLENPLTPHVFTPPRIAMLELLAPQAAMALENSRLYGDLQEREAKIRRLVDANIIGVLLSDADSRIFEANDAFLAILGYTRDDLTSGRLRWRGLTPVEWQAADRRAVAQLRATGRCDLYEKEYVRKDGSRVPVLVAAASIEGTRPEAVAFVLDLTERRRAEEALQNAQLALAHVTRVLTLGELSASIAHEVNQPLAAVVTNASAALRWLEREVPDLDEATQAVRRIRHEGQRASDIIRRIRALAQKAPPQKSRFDLNELILEVLALARSELHKQQVVLHLQLAEELPAVRADRIQVQQVFLNLVLNAIQAMSTVYPPRELRVSSHPEDSQGVRVMVRDSGSGLVPAQMEQLFKAFYTTKAEGTGLGLAISRSIIEAHGGRLWAEANEPRGAIFQFILPSGEESMECKSQDLI